MKTIKIAIQHRKNTHSHRWIEYCKKNNIPFKIVECTDNDIIEQLKDCDGLMWHWGQMDYKALLYARQLTLSLEKMGKKVFPNVASSWHFDDKLGQKYLLEAIGAPFIKSYIFYTKKEALQWINKANFPKVFKLRGGAGSLNVELIKSKNQAKRKVRIAFGRGFASFDKWTIVEEKYIQLRRLKDKQSAIELIKSIVRIAFPARIRKLLPRQMGYVYFQDFMPNNTYDTRVVVVGDRAFAGRRYVRKNDFRASGSGIWAFEKELFDERCIKIAFDTSDKIGSQVMAYDFIFDNDQPKIVEISYATCLGPYDKCEGHWDREMNWHEGKFKQQIWMIEDFIQSLLQN